MHFDDPFEFLGLPPEASDEDVKAAYEKLSADEEKKEAADKAYEQIRQLREQESAEKVQEESDEKPAEEAEEESEEKSQEESQDADSELADRKARLEAEDKPEENKKASPMQMAMGVVTIILLAAVLVALIYNALGQKNPDAAEPAASETAVTETAAEETAVPVETAAPTVPADGNPDDETCKGTYTGTDEQVVAAKDNVVATMGEYKLTNSQLQIYYWMGIQSYIQNSGPYIQFLGLNMGQPLDVQPCPLVEGQTWQQFFVKQAVTSWQNYQGMAAEAKLSGHQMDPELEKFLEELPAQIEQQAKENQFADGNAMLANNVGPGASMEDYLNFMQVYNEGFGYFQDTLTAASPSEAQIVQYMNEHKQELLDQGINQEEKVVSVRHILIAPEDTASEEQWAEAEKKAKDLLNTFDTGSRTEDAFAKLATENTMDPGSQSTGGLYADFSKGQMVPEFEQWSFDAARKNGDTGIVKTEYGYHIMYFVNARTVWQEQVSQVILQKTAEELISSIAEKHPMEVDFSQILIGNLKEQEIAE